MNFSLRVDPTMVTSKVKENLLAKNYLLLVLFMQLLFKWILKGIIALYHLNKVFINCEFIIFLFKILKYGEGDRPGRGGIKIQFLKLINVCIKLFSIKLFDDFFYSFLFFIFLKYYQNVILIFRFLIIVSYSIQYFCVVFNFKYSIFHASCTLNVFLNFLPKNLLQILLIFVRRLNIEECIWNAV